MKDVLYENALAFIDKFLIEGSRKEDQKNFYNLLESLVIVVKQLTTDIRNLEEIKRRLSVLESRIDRIGAVYR